jgi:UPF0716 protein FxsA
MFLRLFLLFTCIPLVELYLLLQIGSIIGAVNTILLVIITGVLGAYLAQQEGFRTLERIRTLMAQGEMPGDPLIDALLILVAGFVLITPGILTDLLGFLMLLPVTRSPIRRWIKGLLERKFAASNAAVYTIDPNER